METMNLFAEEEQARRLERVFQIFASAQEDWAIAHAPGESFVDRVEADDVSA